MESTNSDIIEESKNEALTHLENNHEINYKNIKSFNQLLIKQLEAELELRYLFSTNANSNELIDRLKVNKSSSIDKIFVFGYIRKNAIVLKGGVSALSQRMNCNIL